MSRQSISKTETKYVAPRGKDVYIDIPITRDDLARLDRKAKKRGITRDAFIYELMRKFTALNP